MTPIICGAVSSDCQQSSKAMFEVGTPCGRGAAASRRSALAWGWAGSFSWHDNKRGSGLSPACSLGSCTCCFKRAKNSHPGKALRWEGAERRTPSSMCFGTIHKAMRFPGNSPRAPAEIVLQYAKSCGVPVGLTVPEFRTAPCHCPPMPQAALATGLRAWPFRQAESPDTVHAAISND